MPNTGKVVRVTSRPTRAFTLLVPPQPGPPPVPEMELIFLDVDSDSWALACLAFAGKTDATVTGTPPNCVSVTLP
jgi:hypothetical protein